MTDHDDLPKLFSTLKEVIEQKAERNQLLLAPSHNGQFRLSDLVSLISEAVVVQDFNSRIVHVNSAALKFFGLTESQLRGQSLSMLEFKYLRADETDLPASEIPAAIALNTEDFVLGATVGLRFPRGETRWIKLNAMPFYTSGRALFDEPAGHYVLSSFTDVTEIHDANAEIQKLGLEASKLRSRFQGLFENVPIGLVQIDSNFNFVSVNSAACRFFGYKEDELLETSILDITHPDDVPRSVAAESGLSATADAVLKFEKRYIHKSGKTIFASITVRAIESLEDGRRTRYSVIEDLTAKKDIESRLLDFKNDAEAWQQVLNMHSIVVTTDAAGIITSVNDKFCEISGYSREELLGQDHRILNSGHHSAEFMRNLWSKISEGKVWQGKIKNRAKDGSFYWVATTIMPVLNEAGRPTSYVAVRTDISEQMEQEIDYSYVLDSLKVGVWKWDVTTNELEWDDRMFQLHGGERASYISAQACWDTVLTDDVRTQTRKALDGAVTDQQEFNIIYQVAHRNGTLQELRSRAFVVRDKNGDAIKVHGITIDRNQEAQLEKETEFARATASQNAKLASLGELSAGIAHEVNNPLAIIVGGLGLLSLVRHDEERFEKAVLRIQKASSRIGKIIGGLKKFSRNSEGDEFKVCLLSKITEEVIDLTSMKAKASFSEVRFNLKSDAKIECDEIAIEQVLVNLINNSLDAIKDLDERWVEIELENRGDIAVLSVTDSGPGIPEAIREKLFNPFFTTKPVGTGTGLGLSVVHGILAKHHATIRIVPEARNTRFEITFKIKGIQSIRVLFLDDEPEICELFKSSFETTDITVAAFSDADEALANAVSHPPDVIFLDYKMPVADGDELAFKFNASIPKYLVTGGMVQKTRYPFQKILGKPFNTTLIRNIITRGAS